MNPASSLFLHLRAIWLAAMPAVLLNCPSASCLKSSLAVQISPETAAVISGVHWVNLLRQLTFIPCRIKSFTMSSLAWSTAKCNGLETASKISSEKRRIWHLADNHKHINAHRDAMHRKLSGDKLDSASPTFKMGWLLVGIYWHFIKKTYTCIKDILWRKNSTRPLRSILTQLIGS